MADALTALTCTGDPLLDLLLQECKGFRLLPVTGMTVEDALRESTAQSPAILFISPALGEIRRIGAQVGQTRVCCLIDGETAMDQAALQCDVLTAERVTAELIEAWVSQAFPARGTLSAGRPATVQAPAQPPVQPPVQAPALAPAQAAPAPSAAARFPAPPSYGAASPQPGLSRPPAAAPAPAQAGWQAPAYIPRPSQQPQALVLRQQVVAIWGAKPGTGKSTLAVGISDLLSRMPGVKVCTVDLNPYNSSLAVMLGREQEIPSWVHLSEGLMRGQLPVQDALRWVQPNWAILTGTAGRDDWIGWLDDRLIADLIDHLRTHFDYILLDTESRPGQITETALRLAQTVLLTVSPDYPGILDANRALEALSGRGVLDRTRCRLVLSRWVETPQLPGGEVATCLGLPVSARVPQATEAVMAAAGQGTPVTRTESPAARPVIEGITSAAQLIAESLSAGGARSGLAGSLRSLFGR